MGCADRHHARQRIAPCGDDVGHGEVDDAFDHEALTAGSVEIGDGDGAGARSHVVDAVGGHAHEDPARCFGEQLLHTVERDSSADAAAGHDLTERPGDAAVG